MEGDPMTARVYVRVSTDQQQLDGQLKDLTTYAANLNLPVPIIEYKERVSATGKVPRDEYDKLIRELNAGDHLIVWSFDRFTRAQRSWDGINVIYDLEKRGVLFHSLKESFLNTPNGDDLNSKMMREFLMM